MRKRALLLTISSVLLVRPDIATAADLSDAQAFDLFVKQALQPRLASDERFKPALENADARSFVNPYKVNIDPREKTARKAWYSAQLPSGFPTKGKIRVVYLYPCAFPWVFDDAEGGDITDANWATADRVWIRMALENAGMKVPDLSGIARTRFADHGPAGGLRALNAKLQAQAGPGSQVAVLDPYCGPLYGGGVPPPPPPPPPPMVLPVYVRMTPGTEVYIASEFRAKLCELKTGKAYKSTCRGWSAILSSPIELSGTRYRYVIMRHDQVLKSDLLDLEINQSSADHPIALVTS